VFVAGKGQSHDENRVWGEGAKAIYSAAIAVVNFYCETSTVPGGLAPKAFLLQKQVEYLSPHHVWRTSSGQMSESPDKNHATITEKGNPLTSHFFLQLICRPQVAHIFWRADRVTWLMALG